MSHKRELNEIIQLAKLRSAECQEHVGVFRESDGTWRFRPRSLMKYNEKRRAYCYISPEGNRVSKEYMDEVGDLS